MLRTVILETVVVKLPLISANVEGIQSVPVHEDPSCGTCCSWYIILFYLLMRRVEDRVAGGCSE